MVASDYSYETLTTCVSMILKTSKYKAWTPYYDRNLMFMQHSEYGDLLLHKGKFYIHNKEGVTEIHTAVGKSIMNLDKITAQICQYTFLNGFEKTNEGKYLISMLQFSRLSAAAQRKVDNILNKYKYWVRIDELIADILKKRDASVVKWCTQNRADVERNRADVKAEVK